MSRSSTGAGDARGAQPRVIGAIAGVAIVAGSMLGIGIFLTPPQVAGHLPSPALYLLAWLAGGVIAFSGAVAYAELGTRFPEAGGDYVFLREAFGPSLSFAAGWLLFVGVFTGSVATMAVPLAEFQLPALLAPVTDLEPGRTLWRAGFVEITVARAIGIAIIVLLTAINVLGTRLSAGAQIALTLVPMAVLAASAVAVMVFTDPAPSAAADRTPDVAGFGRAVLAVYFAYAGWNAIAYVGGEMKSPGKTIPAALVGGTALVTALYLLLAATFLFVLGFDGVAGSVEVGTASASAVGGDRLRYAVTATIAIALVGSLNGTILAGGRVGWAMAQRGALHPSLGVLSPRHRTPARALVLMAALAVALILSGTFEMLLELTSLAMFLMGALTVLALFVIRRRDGDRAPYRASLYPYLPGAFVAIALAIIAASAYRALAGDDAWTAASLYPLSGLGLFFALWAARAAFGRRARRP